MSNVKQAGLFACPVVRVDDAHIAVLDWHGIAAKWHKLGAILAVKLVQASLCRLLACSLRRSISDVLLR
jgi:hypothetical protein